MTLLDSICDFLSAFMGSSDTTNDFGNSFLDADMNWASLDAHHKNLANAVDSCGIPLDTSSSCLKRVMKAIGADPSDAAFVRQRIALNLETSDFLDYADGIIRQAEKLLKN